MNYDVVFSSAIISKKALVLSGGYFDNLLKHAEECDLFLRICLNFNAVKIEKVCAKYRIHKGQDSLRNFEVSILEEEYIFAKIKLKYPSLILVDAKHLSNNQAYHQWCHFLNFILKKRPSQARKQLRPYIFNSLKYFGFFILSYFSTSLIIKIWEKQRQSNNSLPFLS